MTVSSALPEVSRALERLANRQDLDREQAAEVLQLIMDGRVGEVQAAAFLMGMRAKGETADEIVGMAQTMSELAERVHVDCQDQLVDTCGTGGDGLGTFNISTTAAFVVAGAGVPVAKHGNRGATSRSGSADLLEALGVRIDLAPEQVARCIRQVGIGFMFAPLHHKAMRHIVPVRRDLGIRTVFNFLGPLTNPAGARRQLVGVSSPDYVRVLGEALALMGAERALVVHGEEGLDELSVTASSQVIEVRDGVVAAEYRLQPEALGLQHWELADVRGAGPEENARITLAILEGHTFADAPSQITLLNAAAALYVADAVDSLPAGIDAAREIVASGAALEKVRQLTAVSHEV